MKLNIWKNQREIEKTYEVESYRVLYGTILDLTKAIDLEALAVQLNPATREDLEFIKIIGNVVYTSRDMINELLLDMFEGLTMDELKRVDINDIIQCLIELIGQAFPLIAKATGGVKKK